jgi:hypothetical protein
MSRMAKLGTLTVLTPMRRTATATRMRMQTREGAACWQIRLRHSAFGPAMPPAVP